MQSNPTKTARVYVSLDVIFDTRMGTLIRQDLEQAEQIFHAGYHERREDAFAGVSMLEYRRRYQDRDVQTLKVSAITNIFAHFKQLNQELMYQLTQGPFHQKITYTVNTYPYRLTAEVEDLMQMLIWNQLGKLIDVHLVYLTDAQVTRAYLKANFEAIYMYDVWSWIERHYREFDLAHDTRLHDIITYAPRLYFARAPSTAEEAELNKAGDIFAEMEKAVSPLMGVNLLPIKLFSTPAPPYYYKNQPIPA